MSIDTGYSVKKGSHKLLQTFQTLYDDVWVSDTSHFVDYHRDTGAY